MAEEVVGLANFGNHAACNSERISKLGPVALVQVAAARDLLRGQDAPQSFQVCVVIQRLERRALLLFDQESRLRPFDKLFRCCLELRR